MKFIICNFLDVKVHDLVVEAGVFPKILTSLSVQQGKILLGLPGDKFGYI